jgi:hypothetical protein
MQIDYQNIKTLDDIGFIGNPQCRRTERKETIFNVAFTVARAKRKELGRELTEMETKQIVKSCENAWRRKKYAEQKAKRKVSGSSPSHSIGSLAAAAM